jgi:predicted RNA-binding Zn ribbon-like protein
VGSISPQRARGLEIGNELEARLTLDRRVGPASIFPAQIAKFASNALRRLYEITVNLMPVSTIARSLIVLRTGLRCLILTRLARRKPVSSSLENVMAIGSNDGWSSWLLMNCGQRHSASRDVK